MRLKPALMLAALMLMSLPAAAQQINCANPMTQVELTFCAEQDWMAADKDLNAAYRGARAQMRELDRVLPEDQRGAETYLRDGQRAWVTFRDATCAAEGFVFRGGSAEPMIIYGCRARLTRARAADLWSMAEGY